jgi:serine/threonine protein kinase
MHDLGKHSRDFCISSINQPINQSTNQSINQPTNDALPPYGPASARAWLQSMYEEIHIISRLDHPNIVKMYEFFEDEKRYYIVTE